MHAVHWGDPEIIAGELHDSKDVNEFGVVDDLSESLAKALEAALTIGTDTTESLQVVQTLLEHMQSPKHVVSVTACTKPLSALLPQVALTRSVCFAP